MKSKKRKLTGESSVVNPEGGRGIIRGFGGLDQIGSSMKNSTIPVATTMSVFSTAIDKSASPSTGGNLETGKSLVSKLSQFQSTLVQTNCLLNMGVKLWLISQVLN